MVPPRPLSANHKTKSTHESCGRVTSMSHEVYFFQMAMQADHPPRAPVDLEKFWPPGQKRQFRQFHDLIKHRFFKNGHFDPRAQNFSKSTGALGGWYPLVKVVYHPPRAPVDLEKFWPPGQKRQFRQFHDLIKVNTTCKRKAHH